MPRQAEIDAPGAVHHIMARGIEQRYFLTIKIGHNKDIP